MKKYTIYIFLLILGIVLFTNSAKAQNNNAPVDKTITNLKSILTEKRQNQDVFAKFLNDTTAQKKIADAKFIKSDTTFKQNLAEIKDGVKKTALGNIYANIQRLTKEKFANFVATTFNFQYLITDIESRINKAKDNGIDVSTVQTSLDKSKKSLAALMTTLVNQAGKTYTINISDNTKLKTEAQTTRDALKTDLETIQTKINETRSSLAETSTILSQIPKINEFNSVPVGNTN